MWIKVDNFKLKRAQEKLFISNFRELYSFALISL